MNSRRPVAITLVVGAALLLRLLVLFFYREVPQLQKLVEGGDAIGYTQLAQNLLSNGSFAFNLGHPTAFRMPGYPLFLAVTYALQQTPLPTQILQIMAEALTVVVAYEIGKSLSTNDKFPLLAAIAVALNPLFIISTVALFPETIAILLISLGTLLLLKLPDSTWAGMAASLALSLSIYFKPTLMTVAIVCLCLFSVRRLSNRKLTSSKLTLLLPFLVTVILFTPWAVRNLLVMRAFIPLTTSNGVNLYGGNNPQADGGYVLAEPYVLPNMSESESDHEFTQRALAWITSDPIDFAKLLPAKAIRFLWPLAFGTSGNVNVPRVVFGLVLMATLAFYIFALVGTWRLAATRRLWEAALLLAPLGCLLFASLLTFGAARFSLPAFPALAVLASLGFEALLAGRVHVS